MKGEEILQETPILVNKERELTGYIAGVPAHMIPKHYRKIGQHKLNEVWILDDNSKVLAGTFDDDYFNVKNRTVFKTGNNAEIQIPGAKKQVQISNTDTVKGAEREGLALLVYTALINDGFAVISDGAQYLGGKRIWESIARTHNVKIWDNNTQDYLRDNNNNVIDYDGTNIDDSGIWNTYNNANKIILLCLWLTRGDLR